MPDRPNKQARSSEIQEEEKKVTPNVWRIATYVSILVILGILLFIILSHNNRSQNLAVHGKSIAVLPFINDSPDKENEYFINGTMTDIMDNLCKIKDLEVLSRTSVEQYRNNPKSIPVIADEMKVSYILSAVMQVHGDNIRLTVQLFDSNEECLWSKPYNREIRQVADVFSMQSEIAQHVAGKIEAVITPEEKERIETIPTTSLSAANYYRRGRAELDSHFYSNEGRDAIERAGRLFLKALECDSTYARAYTGLGIVYWYTYLGRNEILEEAFLDSVLNLVNIALSYDHQLAEAYHLRGLYCMEVSGDKDKALVDYNRALELNPNDHGFYNARGHHFIEHFGDYIRGIEDLEESMYRSAGSELPGKLYKLGNAYQNIGFPDVARQYFLQILDLDGDTAKYIRTQVWEAYINENIETMLELDKKFRKFRPGSSMYGFMEMDAGLDDAIIRHYKEFQKQDKTDDTEPTLWPYYYGYALWLMGEYKEAQYYFNLQIKNSEKIMEFNRSHATWGPAYIDIIKVYAFTGNKAKAFEYLNELEENLTTIPLWMIAMINLCPMIKPIHKEPEYKEIMLKMQAKYQAEHARVRKWLKETGRI